MMDRVSDAIDALQAQIRACRQCTFPHPANPVVAGRSTAKRCLGNPVPG
jgi:uracil-DNA glycosylase